MNLMNAVLAGAVSAVVSQPTTLPGGAPRNLTLQGNIVVAGGGTTCDVWVQSSVDGGATWFDIANFHFTTTSAIKLFNLCASTPVTTEATPTDGTLGANTAVDGLLGPMLRTKLTTTGTYTGASSISIDIASDKLPN